MIGGNPSPSSQTYCSVSAGYASVIWLRFAQARASAGTKRTAGRLSPRMITARRGSMRLLRHKWMVMGVRRVRRAKSFTVHNPLRACCNRCVFICLQPSCHVTCICDARKAHKEVVGVSTFMLRSVVQFAIWHSAVKHTRTTKSSASKRAQWTCRMRSHAATHVDKLSRGNCLYRARAGRTTSALGSMIVS